MIDLKWKPARAFSIPIIYTLVRSLPGLYGFSIALNALLYLLHPCYSTTPARSFLIIERAAVSRLFIRFVSLHRSNECFLVSFSYALNSLIHALSLLGSLIMSRKPIAKP